MVSGMRVNRNILTNGLAIILVLSLSFSVSRCEEAKKPNEEEYDYKPPGYPGSGTNQGKILHIFICSISIIIPLQNKLPDNRKFGN